MLLKLAPALFLLLWSGGFTAGKIGIHHAGPFTLLCIRYALAIAILAPFFLVLRPPLPATRRDWVNLGMAGFWLQGANFAFCFAALKAGAAAGTVALISCLNPVFVAVLAPRIVGEDRAGLRQWLGLALGLLGAGLVIIAKSAVGLTSAVGIMLAFCCTASVTMGTLWEKRFGVPYHPITANFVQCAAALIATAPVAIAVQDWSVDWTGGFTIAVLYLVLGNSILAFSLLTAMIRQGQASNVSALFFLVPPGAAIIAWIVLGEPMPVAGWLGMAVAGAGVALARRSGARKETLDPVAAAAPLS